MEQGGHHASVRIHFQARKTHGIAAAEAVEMGKILQK
jgi:hypothetical protein